MTAQLDFPIGPFARDNDPVTSHAAVPKRDRLRLHRSRALAAFRWAGSMGLTADQCEQITGINGVWRRVSELLALGLLEDAGRTRRTRHGKQARVLVITPRGESAL